MTVMNATRAYTFSPLIRGVIIGGIALFSGFALAVLSLVWSSDKPIHAAAGLALPFLGFCSFLKMFGGLYTRMYDRVLVAEEALIYESAKEMSVTLPWEQVARLVPHGWSRRYDVIDRHGRCRMQISYELDNFTELDATLRKHLQKFTATESTIWFTKTAGGQTFITLAAGLLAMIIPVLWFQGPNAGSLFCLVVAVAFMPYGLYYRIEKVTVAKDGIVIHYWKRQLTIPYTSIKKLSLPEDYIPGAWRTICIEIVGRRPMKIEWIADEAIAFYQAMEMAWKRATSLS